jgi:parallel beta-helix repeat protein
MLGIDAKFAGASLITGNTVTATGTIAFNGWSQGAIRVDAGAKVLDNNIDGSAYHGIHFSGTGGSQVIGNTVSGYCLRLADCGGIYTWNGNKTNVNQSSIVEANQVLGSTANTEGATGFGTEVVAGIFLDDFAGGVTIRNNMVYGAPIGVQVHNGWNNTVESNKLWLPTLVALQANMDQNDKDWLVGNVFRNNQIVPVKTGSAVFPAMPTFKESYPIWFFNKVSGSAGITSGSNVFTGNQVVRLDGSLDGVHAWIRSNTQDLKLSSATWATFNPTDVRTATPLTFAMYTLVLGPEMVTGGSFDTGLGLWSTWFGNSLTPGSAQVSSGAGCTGTCMQLLPGTSTDYLSSPPFSLKPNAPYLYTYTARLAQAATLRYPYIGRAVTPYDSMATGPFSSSSKLSGVAGELIRYEGFFTAKASDPAKVYLQSKTVGVPVSYDNVSVRELTGFSFSTAADWSALAYAPRSGARIVTCDSLGWGSNCAAVGLDGLPVTLPATLIAGTQQLFLRADSTWRR